MAPGDARALAVALRSLADDPARARAMGVAGAALVAERFALGRMLAELHDLFDELAGRRP